MPGLTGTSVGFVLAPGEEVIDRIDGLWFNDGQNEQFLGRTHPVGHMGEGTLYLTNHRVVATWERNLGLEGQFGPSVTLSNSGVLAYFEAPAFCRDRATQPIGYEVHVIFSSGLRLWVTCQEKTKAERDQAKRADALRRDKEMGERVCTLLARAMTILRSTP